MKVIAISGKAGHGKDATASLLKNKLNKLGFKVIIVHYGDLLKFIAEKYLNWDGKKDQEGRELLQWLGTDLIRKKNSNFWVDFVVKTLLFFPEDKWDYVLIPDTRFPNEITQLKKSIERVISLRVERQEYKTSLTPSQTEHPSETSLDDFPFDYILQSQNGLDKLETEVDIFVSWLAGTAYSHIYI